MFRIWRYKVYRLTVTLDVFKFLTTKYIKIINSRLTVTLDVFKYSSIL